MASGGALSQIPAPLHEQIDPQILSLYMSRRFELWASFSGVEIDGHKFSFKNHNYLYPLFSDRAEDIRLMKAAQMGATVFMVLKSNHMALYPEAWGFGGGIKIGFYLPDWGNVSRLVKDRIQPMMQKHPQLKNYLKTSKGNLTLRQIADSTIYFLYMGGVSTKDSVPLNSLFFDEVRLVSLADIFQTYARVLHSWPYRYKHHVSTAGYPNDDIHALFLDSDQKWFYTICQRCGHEQILAQRFPDCIVVRPAHSTRADECYYECEKCKGEITDPQWGRFIAHNPGHENSGYQISQLISRLISPKEILTQFEQTNNKKEFYNSILGMPYVDVENKPISINLLDNNVDTDIIWGEWTTGNNFMGVDQMMGLNYVFVLNRDGKKRRIIWFEIIEDDEPFKRTAELMEEFEIKCCVCDGLPNSSEAVRFANYFKKRVFLAYMGTNKNGDPARWNEGKRIPASQRKLDRDTYHRYKVRLDSYTSIDYTLNLLAKGAIKWGNPDIHLIRCHPYNGGRKAEYPIMRTHAYPMFACPVRERVLINEDSQEFRMQWHYIGMDPHALHALNFAVWASERKISGQFFSF